MLSKGAMQIGTGGAMAEGTGPHLGGRAQHCSGSIRWLFHKQHHSAAQDAFYQLTPCTPLTRKLLATSAPLLPLVLRRVQQCGGASPCARAGVPGGAGGDL
jgi:hypothetical protein